MVMSMDYTLCGGMELYRKYYEAIAYRYDIAYSDGTTAIIPPPEEAYLNRYVILDSSEETHDDIKNLVLADVFVDDDGNKWTMEKIHERFGTLLKFNDEFLKNGGALPIAWINQRFAILNELRKFKVRYIDVQESVYEPTGQTFTSYKEAYKHALDNCIFEGDYLHEYIDTHINSYKENGSFYLDTSYIHKKMIFLNEEGQKFKYNPSVKIHVVNDTVYSRIVTYLGDDIYGVNPPVSVGGVNLEYGCDIEFTAYPVDGELDISFGELDESVLPGNTEHCDTVLSFDIDAIADYSNILPDL